ncbi:hypothetical protein GE061_003403 [Apolygus lucorum]|uniref:C2H2-type domain-containing protein n=1 Tax=Apolygus lucorum TaxID=248454 RepID=A0A8S9X3U0_APOLU|nr:hypothetical protein GE061_003403 [Apolygus lucorum]
MTDGDNEEVPQASVETVDCVATSSTVEDAPRGLEGVVKEETEEDVGFSNCESQEPDLGECSSGVTALSDRELMRIFGPTDDGSSSSKSLKSAKGFVTDVGRETEDSRIGDFVVRKTPRTKIIYRKPDPKALQPNCVFKLHTFYECCEETTFNCQECPFLSRSRKSLLTHARVIHDDSSGTKRKNEGKGLTSLVVEIDERDNTKRIYWVKNEDLTTEIASTTDKKEVQATDEQFEGNLDDEDVNIFDMTTPMKRFNRYDDEECVPSGEEKRLIKMPKTVGQIVKKKSVGQEGHDLKFADITSVYTKPKGGKHFTDDRGYVYYQHSTTPFKRQLKCVFANVAKFKCQTTASMALDPPDSRIVISSKSNPHNHPPENEKTIASRFSKCLKKRVLEEPDVPVKQIYDDEKEKCPLGAEFLPKNIALQRMRRYRRVHMRSLQGQSLKTEPISDDEVPGDSTELELYSEGKVIYVDAKGYQYSQQFASVYKRQLRCVRARKIASERCPARASMLLQPRYSPIKILRRHNHDPEDIDRTIFYYTLKQRAKDEKDKSLRIIYDEEVKRNPESAASFCHPFSKAKQAMQRARKRSYEDQNCSLNDAESIQSEMSITGNYFATVSNSRQSAILDSPLVSYRHQPARDAPPVSIQHSSSQADLVSTRLADDVTDDLSKNVVLQQILIDSGQQLSGSKVFYECPYCKRLFDKEGSLDQHMLDEHVNSFVIDDESLPDKSDNT